MFIKYTLHSTTIKYISLEMLDGQGRTWEEMEVGIEHRFPLLLPH